MSCNGCRVLRKGCSDNCVLRPCLQWIQTAQSQGHATVFLAKFFGRAGLMSFISAVPDNQRPALFQSLLFEAAGRTVNPVSGAVGLLWTGNWHVCQAAVETVLRGGTLKPIPEFIGAPAPDLDGVSGFTLRDSSAGPKVQKRRRFVDEPAGVMHWADLDLSLTPGLLGRKGEIGPLDLGERRRPGSPSMNSEESLTTTCEDDEPACEIKLLKLFG